MAAWIQIEKIVFVKVRKHGEGGGASNVRFYSAFSTLTVSTQWPSEKGGERYCLSLFLTVLVCERKTVSRGFGLDKRY